MREVRFLKQRMEVILEHKFEGGRRMKEIVREQAEGFRGLIRMAYKF